MVLLTRVGVVPFRVVLVMFAVLRLRGPPLYPSDLISPLCMNSLFFSPNSHFFTTSQTLQTTMSSLLPTAAAAARAPPQHRQPDTGYPNNNGGGGTAEDKFERFERWLRENGTYYPEVSRVESCASLT